MSKDGFKLPGDCLEVSRPPSWTCLAAFLFVSACAQQPTVQQPPTAELQPAAPQASAAYTAEELRASAKQVGIQPPSFSGDDVVCRKETRVGTHVRRERCFRRGELGEATRNAQEWLRSGGFQGSPTVVR